MCGMFGRWLSGLVCRQRCFLKVFEERGLGGVVLELPQNH